MKSAAVGVLALALLAPTRVGCMQNDNQSKSKISSETQAPVDKPQDIGKAFAKSSIRQLFYVSPKDKDTNINVKVGSGIIFRTNTYSLVPEFHGGKVEVKIGGERVLEVISQKTGDPPTVFYSPPEIVGTEEFGQFAPSVLLYAREKGSSEVTIKFFNKDKKEVESTKYKVIVE